MGIPAKKSPAVLGDRMGWTTLYRSEIDADVPVVVGYDIEGYKQVFIQSVHVDYGRGEWGPDIKAELDETQLADLSHHVVLQCVEWKPERDQDRPNYAPRRAFI